MRLNEKIELLAALPLLGLLEHEALHVLAFTARERRLRAGEELFHRDEKADCGYLILSGRIALSARGSELAAAPQFGPGALLGETALIAETTRPATAIAIEPSSVLVLPRDLMHRVLEEHPGSAATLRRRIAATVAATEFELKTVLD